MKIQYNVYSQEYSLKFITNVFVLVTIKINNMKDLHSALLFGAKKKINKIRFSDIEKEIFRSVVLESEILIMS